MLADAAADFGLLHMEVVHQSDASPLASERRHRLRQSAWSLDFPLLDDGEMLVLRIHARMGDEFRPYGAERIANVLGPALVGRLAAGPTTAGSGAAKTRSAARVHV